MREIFHKIHLWLSIPFGLVITLICFSGAMLVFENEVMELCRRDFYYTEKVEGSPLPMDRLIEKVAAVLPDSVSVSSVTVSSDPARAYKLGLSKPRRAAVYVDQYSGEIKGRYERSSFFLTMFRMHRWLLDSMKPDGGIFWGKMIVGVSTMMFVFVLLSGIIVWWPRTKKAFRNSLKITVNKGWLRLGYDLHVAGGLYAFVLLLAMALTGLTWSFPWYRAGFYKVFGVEAVSGGGHGQAATANKAGKPEGRDGGHAHSGKEKQGRLQHVHWQQVYEKMAKENPDYDQISVSAGTVSVSFDCFGNQRAADRYTFSPRSGEITGVTLYQDTERADKIRGWIYSVHVGNWGGLFSRILTFVVTLFGASLPLTGYYLWIRKLKRQSKRGGKRRK